MESVETPFKDVSDFHDIYEPFFDWVAERYWTAKEREVCGPLVKDAIVDYMERKFGAGKAFTIEKICMLVTCKEEEQ